ncbi:MAG: hypothetical protein GKS02_13840 [Alphaproteobacteria bacterium]|nr:hypothetical protein [Alphaproteobacteria bacterium]
MRRLVFLMAVGLLAVVAANTAAIAQSAPRHSAGPVCRESGPLPNQIRCFLDAAEAEGDVGQCDGAYDFAVRFNCISKFAENSGDPVACERIPIRNNRLLLMRDSCVSGVAAATRAPQLCEQVQLDVVRDSCFLIQVLDLEANPQLCENITKAAVREICSENQ